MADGPGRPKKLDDTVKKLLCDAIQLGNPVEVAVDYAGISESTFYEYMRRGEAGDPEYLEFSQDIKRARGRGAVTNSNRIEQAAKDGNWWAASWKLTHGPYKHLYRESNPAQDRAEADNETRNSAIIAAAERTREMLLRRYGTTSLEERLKNVKPI